MPDETEPLSTKINPDIVYREMYTEMRRYRDYELAIARWYTTFSLGYLGAVFFLLHGDAGNKIRDDLGIGPKSKVLLTILGAFICLFGAYSAWYSTNRYDFLRRKVTEVLEPEWSKEFKPRVRIVEPGYLIWFMPFALFAATCWVIYSDDRNVAWGLTVGTVVAFIFWLFGVNKRRV